METLLHRGPGKNTRKTQDDSNPVWIVRKPPNTFEPRYRQPEVRNLEGPWRRPALESSSPHMVETETGIKVTPKLLNTESEACVQTNSENEEIEVEQTIDDMCPSDMLSNKDTNKCCDMTDASNDLLLEDALVNKQTNSSDKTLESPDKRRDASQLRFRPVWTNFEKSSAEPEKQIKIVTGTGKKKKTKNLVIGGNKQGK